MPKTRLIRSFFLIEHLHQTDRQTDRHRAIASTRASIASRGKNCLVASGGVNWVGDSRNTFEVQRPTHTADATDSFVESGLTVWIGHYATLCPTFDEIECCTFYTANKLQVSVNSCSYLRIFTVGKCGLDAKRLATNLCMAYCVQMLVCFVLSYMTVQGYVIWL